MNLSAVNVLALVCIGNPASYVMQMHCSKNGCCIPVQLSSVNVLETGRKFNVLLVNAACWDGVLTTAHWVQPQVNVIMILIWLMSLVSVNYSDPWTPCFKGMHCM